ncbi:L,D-transpeptidase [Nostoc sp.]|uniref:L,D-transpeptidase n=1 Tax=Nostoc sp. TaxID=1180 RepID=UPI002FFB7CB5
MTTIAVLISLQSYATAQVTNNQPNYSQVSPQVESNSLPLQSNIPNYSERKRRLLLKFQRPIKPIIPNTSEQEIHLLLKLNERKLYVYRGDSLQASYPVAIGKPGWETPTGKFKIIHMVQNPAWENPFVGNREIVPPSSNNPLGERWIGFWTDGKDEIGFHGTPNVKSVGQAVSHGCVRMYNKDVRKLYEFVKIGTPVLVSK